MVQLKESNPLKSLIDSGEGVESAKSFHSRLSTLDSPDVRWDKVRAVRSEIASGTYETDWKIQKALERLLVDLSS